MQCALLTLTAIMEKHVNEDMPTWCYFTEYINIFIGVI